MWAMNRKVTSMPSVKSSLRRRSGILKASTAAFSSGALIMGWLLDSFDGTAREIDLFARPSGEFVGADGEFNGQLALTQDFDGTFFAAHDAGDLEFLRAN